MRIRNNIVDFKHSVGIILGVITALMITFSQSLYYVADSSELETPSKEQTSQEDDAESVLTAQNDLLGSGGQQSISHTWHLNIIIPFDDFRDFTSECLKAVDYNTQFRTLFRTLISPNAP